MAKKKETDLTGIESLLGTDFIRVLSGGGSRKIQFNKFPRANNTQDGLATANIFVKAFKISSLPAAGTNVVGDCDDYDSGYGWYNNTGTGLSDYAPGSSAGLFIRFKANVVSITFFFITVGNASGQLWYRVDGEIGCKMVG